MIAYAIEATHCKALVTFIQIKISCVEHTLSSNFIQSGGHIKFVPLGVLFCKSSCVKWYMISNYMTIL